MFYQAIHIYYGGTTAFGNTLSATAIQQSRVVAFGRRHGMNDGFNTLEGVIFNVDILQGLSHAGNHPHKVLNITHFFDLLQLRQKIVEIKLVLCQFFLKLSGFLLIELLLGFLNQRHNVAHAQDTVGHTTRVKQVDGFHFFTNTHELDGLINYRTNGKRCTTAGVAIEFR